jgi:hypothetical protein
VVPCCGQGDARTTSGSCSSAAFGPASPSFHWVRSTQSRKGADRQRRTHRCGSYRWNRWQGLIFGAKGSTAAPSLPGSRRITKKPLARLMGDET